MGLFSDLIDERGFWIVAAALISSCAPANPEFTLLEGRKTGQLKYQVVQDADLGTINRITFDRSSMLGAFRLAVYHNGNLVKNCDESEWEMTLALVPNLPGKPSIEYVGAPKHEVTCTLAQVYDTMDVDLFANEELVSRYRFLKPKVDKK